jgi:hypothetical protein
MATSVNGVAMAELCGRIDSLDLAAHRLRTAQLAADLEAIRHLAAASGFGAVQPVIRAIEAALARGERGPAVASGLALLRDAARCGNDARGGAVFAAAACNLRISG